MSGIAGFYHPEKNFMKREEASHRQLRLFQRRLQGRGPDDDGTYLSAHCGLVHSRLSSLPPDPDKAAVLADRREHQPAFLRRVDVSCALVMDGELYNKKELEQEFAAALEGTDRPGDAMVMLAGYLTLGADFIRKVNGVFSAAVYDRQSNILLLYRDRLGVRPLFFTSAGEDVLFASEIKALLSYPGVTARLDRDGLNEIFALGPARTPGKGVFLDIEEIRPGHFLRISPEGVKDLTYWQLESLPHEDSQAETVEKTAFLIQDAVRRQLKPEFPVCTFLSGGVDSSLVSAICAAELKKQNRRLTTFSFEFQDSEKFFRPSSCQPSLDAPYVRKMVQFLDSDHSILTCTSRDQFDALNASVEAHDLPCMADVDSSMLFFCRQVGARCRAALTGECADEIFGGYPWFHRPEFLKTRAFPWSLDPDARKALLKDDFAAELNMEEYAAQAYETSRAETPLLPGESQEQSERRVLSYLNLRWFMQTLLNRMDRDAAAGRLTARVPFADYRIVEYLWNVPWEIRAKGGVAKALLREAGRGLLPDEILFRKKSPYPKTYDTGYEAMVAGALRRVLEDSSSPILPFLDREKTEKFLSGPADYGRPWYGQLMAAPQMMAYILQLNHWLKTYHVTIL